MSKKNTSNDIKSKIVKVPLSALVFFDKFCGTLAFSSLVSHGKVARIIRSMPIQFLRNYTRMFTTHSIREFPDSHKKRLAVRSMSAAGTDTDPVEQPSLCSHSSNPTPHPHSRGTQQQPEGNHLDIIYTD